MENELSVINKIICKDYYGNELNVILDEDSYDDESTASFIIRGQNEDGDTKEPISINLSLSQRSIEYLLPILEYFVVNGAFPTDEELEDVLDNYLPYMKKI